MSPPLAYFLSWTTKGSWLPGDPRGWVHKDLSGIRAFDQRLFEASQSKRPDDGVLLNDAQRRIVEHTIRDHCTFRGWRLHAVNVRTNHVHVVVTANDVPPETALEQFKAWCSRRLNEHAQTSQTKPPRKWWTPHGSTRWINDDDYLHNAIDYVLHHQ